MLNCSCLRGFKVEGTIKEGWDGQGRSHQGNGEKCGGKWRASLEKVNLRNVKRESNRIVCSTPQGRDRSLRRRWHLCGVLQLPYAQCDLMVVWSVKPWQAETWKLTTSNGFGADFADGCVIPMANLEDTFKGVALRILNVWKAEHQ